MKRRDLTGHRNGILTVCRFHETNLKGSYWVAVCDCGNEKILRSDRLKLAKSCGCMTEKLKNKTREKHGKCGTPTYRIWSTMLDRCRNPNNKKYHRYGGRGISVCNEWELFENFYSDMGERPEGKSIDRIDNNLGYSKDNCRWATSIEQGQNLEKNIMVTSFGVSKPVSWWARNTGINYDTLKYRIKAGWKHEVAVTKIPGIKEGHTL